MGSRIRGGRASQSGEGGESGSLLSASVALLMSVGAANASDVQLGQRIYGEQCARCHGANLEGQPNWMTRLPNGRLPSPPHDATGHTWHHSDAQLFRVMKEGLGAIAPGYETEMPTFGGVLTDQEILAVLDYIKSTWPARQRDFQRARSQEP
ncbi:MAG: cytochrome c [Devosia sp.]